MEPSRCGRTAVAHTDCGKQTASRPSYIGVIVIPGVMVFPDFHTRSQKCKCRIGRFEIHIEEFNGLLENGLSVWRLHCKNMSEVLLQREFL
jgi:hypothetical protein